MMSKIGRTTLFLEDKLYFVDQPVKSLPLYIQECLSLSRPRPWQTRRDV